MSKSLHLTISIALTLCALVIPTVRVLAQPVRDQSYAWSGEVMMYDEKGKTVTVKAPYLEHINRYIGEFRRGDKVMLNWATPRPGETEAVRYVGRYDATSGAKWGYVLPVEFVSADTAERRLTFTVGVPPNALKALKKVPSGGWIKVTTPFNQPNETAVIVAVEPLVGASPDHDLGVLRLNVAASPSPVAIGTRQDLKIGQRVLAIGVNTAIFSPSGASSGVGFAVPIDTGIGSSRASSHAEKQG